MNRVTAKTFYKSLDKFDTQKELVERATDPVNPSLKKSHSSNRAKLEDSFLNLCHDWKNFKRDLNLKDEDFNGMEEDGVTAKYEYNDKWMEEFKTKYFILLERSDEILESPTMNLDSIQIKEAVS